MKQLTVLILMFCLNTFPDTILTYSTTLNKKILYKNQFILNSKYIRIDKKEDLEKISILYNNETQKLFTLNHLNKTYTELSKVDLDQLNDLIKEYKPELTKQIESLNEVEKTVVKKYIESGTAQTPQLDFTNLKQSMKVINLSCDLYKDNQSNQIFCLTDFNKLKISSKEFLMINDMSQFINQFWLGGLKAITPILSLKQNINSPKVEKYISLYKYEKSNEGEKKTFLSQIKYLKSDFKLFEIPKNYKKSN